MQEGKEQWRHGVAFSMRAPSIQSSSDNLGSVCAVVTAVHIAGTNGQISYSLTCSLLRPIIAREYGITMRDPSSSMMEADGASDQLTMCVTTLYGLHVAT